MSHAATPMKFIAAGLCCAAAGVSAAEFGSVVSATPVVASVPVAQRQCVDEPVAVPPATSGGGALLGAVLGAAVGSTLGGGTGKVAATGIGMVAGAAIGDRVEANGAPPATTTVRRCQTVTRYEQRTVAYDVVYDYAGIRRSARLPKDPGSRIALEVSVTPIGALPPGRLPAGPAAPGYRSPADWQHDDEEQPPPPRRATEAPQPVVLGPAAPSLSVSTASGPHGSRP